MNSLVILAIAIGISYGLMRIFFRVSFAISCSNEFLYYFFAILGVIAGVCLLMSSMAFGIHLYFLLHPAAA